MPIVALPDGRTVEFPEGATPSLITGALRKDFPQFFGDPERAVRKERLQQQQAEAREEGDSVTWGTGYRAEQAGAFGNLARGVAQVPAGLLKTAGTVADAVRRYAPDDGLRFDVGGDQSALSTAGEWIEQQANRLPTTDPEALDAQFQTGIGQLGGMMTGGGVVGKLAGKAVTRGALAAGASEKAAERLAGRAARAYGQSGAVAAGFGQEFSDAYDRASGLGDDPDTALAKSLGYASVATMIESAAGAGRLFRQYFPSPQQAQQALTKMGVSRVIAGNFLAGYGEEASQRISQNLIVEPGSDPLAGAHEEGRVGALVQGLVGLPAAGRGYRPQTTRLPDGREVVVNQETGSTHFPPPQTPDPRPQTPDLSAALFRGKNGEDIRVELGGASLEQAQAAIFRQQPGAEFVGVEVNKVELPESQLKETGQTFNSPATPPMPAAPAATAEAATPGLTSAVVESPLKTTGFVLSEQALRPLPEVPDAPAPLEGQPHERDVETLPTSQLPDSAKGAIWAAQRSDMPGIAGSRWALQTVPVESLRAANAMLWGTGAAKFTPRKSMTSGPLVVAASGEVVDGNNRLFEAIQRGDETIQIYAELKQPFREARVVPLEKFGIWQVQERFDPKTSAWKTTNFDSEKAANEYANQPAAPAPAGVPITKLTPISSSLVVEASGETARPPEMMSPVEWAEADLGAGAASPRRPAAQPGVAPTGAEPPALPGGGQVTVAQTAPSAKPKKVRVGKSLASRFDEETLRVKDGPKFGVNTVFGESTLKIDYDSLERSEPKVKEQPAPVAEVKVEKAKQIEDVPKNRQAESAVAAALAPAMNDLNGKPTGWQFSKNPVGVTLVSPDGKQMVKFHGNDASSGTEAMRQFALAQVWAIENPLRVATPKGELVVEPLAEAWEAGTRAGWPSKLEEKASRYRWSEGVYSPPPSAQADLGAGAASPQQKVEPESFGSVEEMLQFRSARIQEEVELYRREIGLSQTQAAELQGLLAREVSLKGFEKRVGPALAARMDSFFEASPYNKVGGPFQFWDTDRHLNPENVSREADKSQLAATLVGALARGVELKVTSDRFLSAAIASRRLGEAGGTLSDIGRALDAYTTRESGSASDKAWLFKSLGKKVNDFLALQGVNLPSGDLATGLTKAPAAQPGVAPTGAEPPALPGGGQVTVAQAAPSAKPKKVRVGKSLAPAESVAEQTERLAQEQAHLDAKAQRAKLSELQSRALRGTTGDLGQGDLIDGPQDLFAPPSPKPDRIEAALDEAEAKLKGAPGEVMEGVTGAPVWVTKVAARGVIQVVRAVYRASKDLAAALRAGLEWLRAQNLPGFSESQAAGWLNATITTGQLESTNPNEPERFKAATTSVAQEIRRNPRSQPTDFTPPYEGWRAGAGWNSALGMSNNAANAIAQGKLMEQAVRVWVAETLGLPDRAVTHKAVSAANVNARNIYPEYHHVGSRTVNFYDPEELLMQPKFWLGLVTELKTKSHQEAARRQALAAWQAVRDEVIKRGELGTWSTAKAELPRPRHRPLSAEGMAELKTGLSFEEAKRRDAGRAAEREQERAEAYRRAFIEAAATLPSLILTTRAALSKARPGWAHRYATMKEGALPAELRSLGWDDLATQIARGLEAVRRGRDANAPVAGGAAGIKTPLGSPEADKGGVSALQPEGASALTSPTESGAASSVKPEAVAADLLAETQPLAQKAAADASDAYLANLSANPFLDPRFWKASLVSGARVLRDLGQWTATRAQWAAAMVKRFGERIRRALDATWSRLMRLQNQQANGVDAITQGHLNQIEIASGKANVAEEAKPLYSEEQLAMGTPGPGITSQPMSRQIAFFGGKDLLASKQKLDVTGALQAAAVKKQSDNLWEQLVESSAKANPLTQWKLPSWLIGTPRARTFKTRALHIAARLNATGRGPSGNFTFADFTMRAGTMSPATAAKSQMSVGDTFAVNDPLTGVTETLALGPLITTPEGRVFHQLERKVNAATQEKLYNHFAREYPEMIWFLDLFIDPALAGVRQTINGIEVPVFNRFAAAAMMAEGNPNFTALTAYTPDVLVTRSLLGSIRGALSFPAGTRSPGRKYKSGTSREGGHVRDLLSGFNVRTWQMLQEQSRREWMQAVLKTATPIKQNQVPKGWVKLETGMEELWQAVKRLRNWNSAMDPATGLPLFPETEQRLKDDQSPEYKAFFLEAVKLRGKHLMLPKALVDQLVRKYVAHVEHGTLFRLGSWLVRNSTQLFLVAPVTVVNNVLTNDLMTLQAATRRILMAVANGRMQDARFARELFTAEFFKWFPGLRTLVDPQWRAAMNAGVLPENLFADQTMLADLKVRLDEDPLSYLRQGEIGAAALQFIRYGSIDVRAKTRLAYAWLRAQAVTNARKAGLRGDAERAAVDAYLANPPVADIAAAVEVAGFELLNYADSPAWLEDAASGRFRWMGSDVDVGDFGRLVFPFPRFGYHFIAKAAREAAAVKVLLGKVPKGQRADAFADLITFLMWPAGGLGLLAAYGLKGLGDDDDEARKRVGTASIKSVDDDGNVVSKPLPRDLITSNRINLSAWARGLGLGTDREEDFWLRVRAYPVIAMAGAALLAEEDARKLGAAEGAATYAGAVKDLAADFFSVGMALKVPAKVLNDLGNTRNERTFLDPYAAGVPTIAYVTDQTLDSFIPGSRQFDLAIKWLDPIARRRAASKTLDFQPGVWHAARVGHVTGLLDRLLAGEDGTTASTLPPEGKIDRRSGTVLVPQEYSLTQRLAELGGFNIRPIDRSRYEEALSKFAE